MNDVRHVIRFVTEMALDFVHASMSSRALDQQDQLLLRLSFYVTGSFCFLSQMHNAQHKKPSNKLLTEQIAPGPGQCTGIALTFTLLLMKTTAVAI